MTFDSTPEADAMLSVLQKWIASAPDAALIQIQQAAVAEQEQRKRLAEEAVRKRFADVLETVEACFATEVRYTSLKLTREQFVVHSEMKNYFDALAARFSTIEAVPENQTPLKVLQLLQTSSATHHSVYVFVDQIEFTFLISKDGGGGALISYLERLTLTGLTQPDKTVHLVAPASLGNAVGIALSTNNTSTFDMNDRKVQKHASRYWLNQIAVADAKAALNRITDREALIRLCVGAMQPKSE